jgi:hypothetical protein
MELGEIGIGLNSNRFVEAQTAGCWFAASISLDTLIEVPGGKVWKQSNPTGTGVGTQKLSPSRYLAENKGIHRTNSPKKEHF